MAAAAATVYAAASSSFLKLTLLRFPNRLLSSSSSSSLHLFAASYLSLPLSVPSCHHPLSAFPLPYFARAKKALAVAGGEEKTAVIAAVEEKVDDGDDGGSPDEVKAPVRRPCALYVCNLPRSCDISQLLDLFKPYGTVHSVEVSRDAETGLSRGCGYVTMSSIQEAKAAMTALDGSDLGGREMLVKFSADMGSGRKNMEALNTAPKKNMVFESPHKVYIGNLAWSVRPEDLREYFGQFGNVVSTRVLYDRKGGRNRVYGFVSFTSSDELKAAVETSGTVFHGRTLVVREVINREEM